MSSIPMPSPAVLAPQSLSGRQLKQLQAELERELRRLTGTAALEWLSLPSTMDNARSLDGARMHNRVNRVLEALDRIKSDTYGICAGCRSRIPFERLEVIPEATTCVRCSQK